MSVDDLLRRGDLEAVAPDAAEARTALDEAGRHVDSASAIAARDRNGAYQLAYDAARKAVVAHCAPPATGRAGEKAPTP